MIAVSCKQIFISEFKLLGWNGMIKVTQHLLYLYLDLWKKKTLMFSK